MSRRYCPSCDKAGLAYTMWKGADSEVNDNDYCEYDSPIHNEHYTYMLNGRYLLDVTGLGARCLRGCSYVVPFDDGVRCCQIIPAHTDLWRLLVDAMEKEAKQGSPVAFDPETWKMNFPRRTAELVVMFMEKAAAALADKLPAVLVGIISEYFI
jgi:hypothetical protein